MSIDTPAHTTVTSEPARSPALGPRIRWGGIVWGLFFSALGFAGLWIVGSPERREAAGVWLEHLTVPTIVGSSVLALGVILLVAGLVGLLRRAQKSLARRENAG